MPAGGGVTVKVSPPSVMVVGAVNEENVRVFPLLSVAVTGGGLETGADGGGNNVRDTPPVTSVDGVVPVKGGRVETVVPTWITLPLRMMDWPSVAVVVMMLTGGAEAGGGGGGAGGDGGGMKVKVWLPIVTVIGAVPVTVGTSMVSVPMIITDPLGATGGLLGDVPGVPVVEGSPIVEPEHVV